MMTFFGLRRGFGLLTLAMVMLGGVVTPARSQKPAVAAAPTDSAAAGVELAPDFVIGPDDVLSIVFWREKELSAEVTVRPDGKISLPLMNDIVAAGLTPDQLRERVLSKAAHYIEDAQATVVVKTVNSRRVFITGQIEKPGTYPLTNRTTVLQLIATAGGLKEFAKPNKIVVMRNEKGREQRYLFDYDDVIEGKNLQQNLELKPGDTVVVP